LLERCIVCGKYDLSAIINFGDVWKDLPRKDGCIKPTRYWEMDSYFSFVSQTSKTEPLHNKNDDGTDKDRDSSQTPS
jgi:hypothetical protein